MAFAVVLPQKYITGTETESRNFRFGKGVMNQFIYTFENIKDF